MDVSRLRMGCGLGPEIAPWKDPLRERTQLDPGSPHLGRWLSRDWTFCDRNTKGGGRRGGGSTPDLFLRCGCIGRFRNFFDPLRVTLPGGNFFCEPLHEAAHALTLISTS